MAVTTIICANEVVSIWRHDGRPVVSGARLAPAPIEAGDDWRARARLVAGVAEQFFGQERDEPPD